MGFILLDHYWPGINCINLSIYGLCPLHFVLYSFRMIPIFIQLPEPYGAVRTVAQGKGPMLLVGTTRNCILHGTWDLGLNPLIMGHTEEIWALAVHPSQFQFLTGGHDKILRMWDSMARAPVWSKDMEVSSDSDLSHQSYLHKVRDSSLAPVHLFQ